MGRYLVLWVFVLFIVLTLAASATLFNSAYAETKYLKKEDVTKTMIEYNKALGVKCNFCHTPDNSQTLKDLVWETAEVDKSQLRPLVHKQIATAMLGAMLYLNQKEGKNLTCNTCHKGSKEVELK